MRRTEEQEEGKIQRQGWILRWNEMSQIHCLDANLRKLFFFIEVSY